LDDVAVVKQRIKKINDRNNLVYFSRDEFSYNEEFKITFQNYFELFSFF